MVIGCLSCAFRVKNGLLHAEPEGLVLAAKYGTERLDDEFMIFALGQT
jgi:hypothetical protein